MDENNDSEYSVFSRPSLWKIAIAIIVIASLTLFIVYSIGSMSRQRENARLALRKWVDLREKSGSEEFSSPKVCRSLFRIAVAPVISPKKSIGLYQGLIEYIGNKMEMQGVLIQRKTYTEINELLRCGQCDIAFVCTYAYVRGKKEFGMELLAIPKINGKTFYRSLIIVPRSSNAVSLFDLRGKRFASADILSFSGYCYPLAVLKQKGKATNTFFARHIITGGHNLSIYAVANGDADGAAVDSLIYEHMLKSDPKLKQRVKVIQRSPRVGMPPVVINSQADAKLKKRIRDVLLNMDSYPEGRKQLRILGIECFAVPHDEDYKLVEEFARWMEKK